MISASPAVYASVPMSPGSVAPLRVSNGLRALRTTGHAVVADLELDGVRVPAAGGSFDVYLIDPKTPSSRGISIGMISLESPVPAGLTKIHVIATLDRAALALLRSTSSPSIRLVSRFGGRPIAVTSAKLSPT
jgi:hypothetical protein